MSVWKLAEHEKRERSRMKLGLRAISIDSLTLPSLLSRAAVTQYEPLFKQHEIDLEALFLLNDADLANIGIPLGPRRRLLATLTAAMQDTISIGNDIVATLRDFVAYVHPSRLRFFLMAF
jgi:hypothetical protein